MNGKINIPIGRDAGAAALPGRTQTGAGTLIQKRVDYLSISRNAFQVLFGLFVLYLGWRFYCFVRYFETGGATAFVERPPGVEGFLPIGALMALRYWLATGVFDPVHPAALSVLLAVLLVSLLFKKAFCSWLCPVGTLSEGLDLLGEKLFGSKRPVLPRWLDLLLRSFKYVLLGFFVWAIFVLMSVPEVGAFLNTPYYAVSDVKMLRFFTNLSRTVLYVLSALLILSVIYRHFWCRYLCPYGALLGLVSILSPFKVTRNAAYCEGCRRCENACPAHLKISRSRQIWSPECTACLRCLGSCPSREALKVMDPLGRVSVNRWIFGGTLLVVFFGFILVARLTGHWQTVLSPADYSVLIPQSFFFNHPGEF